MKYQGRGYICGHCKGVFVFPEPPVICEPCHDKLVWRSLLKPILAPFRRFGLWLLAMEAPMKVIEMDRKQHQDNVT